MGHTPYASLLKSGLNSMWFKNLQLFRFLKPCTLTAESLEQQLATHRFHPCGSLELHSVGWIPPLGEETNALVHENNHCLIFAIRRQERILPATVVRDLVNEKIKKIETEQQRTVRGRERKAIKEEALQELIPRAFTRSQETRLYIDLNNQWLLIDAGSQKRAQDITSFLRKTLGSLPIIAPQLIQKVDFVLTDWLRNQQLPPDLVLADACQLVENNIDGASVSCKRQDLHAEEVLKHLEAGKQVSKLALNWQERVSFVIDDAFGLKKLEFLSVEEDENPAQDAAEQFDRDFALMNLELAAFLKRLIECFGGENEAAYSAMV